MRTILPTLRRTSTLAAALTAMATAAGPASAQDPPTPPMPQVPDSVREMFMEFQQIQQRLAELQDQAIQGSPELQQKQQAVQESVNEAMVEIDPGTEARLERLDSIETEFTAAQSAADTTRLQELMAEGQQIQQALQSTQQQALAQEDVQASVESFRADLMSEMEQIEPELDSMITRMEALAERLRASQPGQG